MSGDPAVDTTPNLRKALQQKGKGWYIEHLDVGCDGCDQEPIVGERYMCTVCEDRDLCHKCIRALVAARVLKADVSSLHSSTSKEDTDELQGNKWVELSKAVPCLDPAHKFVRVEGPGRAVTYIHSGNHAALDGFLAAFPPSQASCEDVAWVWMYQDASTCSPSYTNLDVETALDAWDELQARRPPLIAKNLAAGIDHIATTTNILSGKWMLFPNRREVDSTWRLVANAVAANQLGPHAKVASVSPTNSEQVICVYTKDFSNVKDVLRVSAELRALVLQLNKPYMYYKTDIYTILGIYTENAEQLGLKTTRHTSKLML